MHNAVYSMLQSGKCAILKSCLAISLYTAMNGIAIRAPACACAQWFIKACAEEPDLEGDGQGSRLKGRAGGMQRGPPYWGQSGSHGCSCKLEASWHPLCKTCHQYVTSFQSQPMCTASHQATLCFQTRLTQASAMQPVHRLTEVAKHKEWQDSRVCTHEPLDMYSKKLCMRQQSCIAALAPTEIRGTASKQHSMCLYNRQTHVLAAVYPFAS